MDGPIEAFLPGPPSCSVCLEAVNDPSERSIAKLICGHQFHLDCIGSAFNAKGSMQCPNCRHTEHGHWLYANHGRHREEPFLGPPRGEREYDFFAEAILGVSEHWVDHFPPLSPYQEFDAPFSLEVGLADDQHLSHSELVVDVLVGENLEGSELLYGCPMVLAQTPALVTHVSGGEENVRVQESGAHPQHGAWHQMQHASSRGHWDFHQPSSVAPAAGVRLSRDESIWPYLGNRSTVHTAPTQARRWSIPSAQSIDNRRGSQISSSSPHYTGQFAMPNANWESDSRNNASSTQWRHGRSSAFQQYLPDREVQRWAHGSLSGLYGAHMIRGSELPSQAQFRSPAAPIHNERQAGFQAFSRYSDVEDLEIEPSVYPPR